MYLFYFIIDFLKETKRWPKILLCPYLDRHPHMEMDEIGWQPGVFISLVPD